MLQEITVTINLFKIVNFKQLQIVHNYSSFKRMTLIINYVTKYKKRKDDSPSTHSVSMLKQFAGYSLTVNPIKPHIIYSHIN